MKQDWLSSEKTHKLRIEVEMKGNETSLISPTLIYYRYIKASFETNVDKTALQAISFLKNFMEPNVSQNV